MQLAAATRSGGKPKPAAGWVPARDVRSVPVVAVVDDEKAVREAMAGLLRSAGFSAECFGSAEAFLERQLRRRFSCLVLDVGLPGMSGLDLQKHLAASRSEVSIVFITAFDDRDNRMQARALAAGAVGFFRKPFDDEALLSVIRCASQKDD
jgi:FixJ family two-component response regulator